MYRRLQNSFVAVLLIVAVGGHWTFLQGVAWTGMMIRFSQTDTVAEAISKTFDGNHPCGLCKAVSHGKKSEQKNQLVKPELKMTFLCSMPSQGMVWAPTEYCTVRFGDEPNALLFESPPIPPPRLA